jgi:polar amino acid transport system substrate-binding protein
MLALGSCGKQKLVVGITDYAPMDFKDENGNWIGFDAELATMFAEYIGREVVFQEIIWDNKVADLNSGAIDLVWNGMTASDELGEKIDFSTPYARNSQVLVVKSGSAVNAANVAQFKVAVEKGSAGNTVAEEIIGATDLVKAQKQLGAILEVAAGACDVAVVDLTLAKSVLGKGEFEDLVMIEGTEYGAEVFAVGLKTGNSMKAQLDEFLKAKYEDGTLARLAEKYESVVVNEEAFN